MILKKISILFFISLVLIFSSCEKKYEKESGNGHNYDVNFSLYKKGNLTQNKISAIYHVKEEKKLAYTTFFLSNSKNHMRAFIRQLNKEEGKFKPSYLTKEQFENIINIKNNY